MLAVGAHLKNTIALSVGPQVFLSQHIGDLETDLAYEAFRRVIADFERLYEATPALIAADAHPDYLSTKFAHALVSGSSRREGVLPKSSTPFEVGRVSPSARCGVCAKRASCPIGTSAFRPTMVASA